MQRGRAEREGSVNKTHHFKIKELMATGLFLAIFWPLPLVSLGFSYYQDTPQSGSKLYIEININIDQCGKYYNDRIFAILPSPSRALTN